MRWLDSVRPHRRQPTRLPRPWDSPGIRSPKPWWMLEWISSQWYVAKLPARGRNFLVARESWGWRSSHCRAEETSPKRVSGT